jgi:hypothetical protein
MATMTMSIAVDGKAVNVLPTAYKYDVFLSYSRAQQWPKWVRGVFLPIVEHWLSAELGRDVVIFHDARDIGIGHIWTGELEQGLASSRVMITLWSKNYFQSEWCLRELSAVLARADDFRSRGLSGRIVFPVAIHDSTSEDLPELARSLQLESIQQFADPFTHEDSPLRESLSRTLQGLCRQAAQEITAVPDDTFSWPMLDYSSYIDRLRIHGSTPIPRPTLGGPP